MFKLPSTYAIKGIGVWLVENGHITLKEAFLDGTKIEASANRYTFVWGRSIKTVKQRIEKRLDVEAGIVALAHNLGKLATKN